MPKRDVTVTSRRSVDAELYIRIDLGPHGALGPGKVRLLELIAEHGSITAAGKAMGMSYRRAWVLVDTLNAQFREPLVAKQTGGSGGGGAVLTELGAKIVGEYRALERTASRASGPHLSAIVGELA